MRAPGPTAWAGVALAALALGGLALWLSRGAALVLDLSWVGCL